MVQAVKDAVYDIKESLTSLSTLGRIQMGLLLGNSLLTLIILNAAGSYSRDAGDHRVDEITLAISLVFTLGSVVGFIYTIRVESPYAFAALVALQVEQAAFVTAAAVGNVLTSWWAKWLVMSTNIMCILAFLFLQLFVRQTWGWHAYKAIGGSAESIKMYQRYQKLAATIFLDLIHAIFFIIAEEIVVQSNDKAQWARVYGATIPCLVLGFVLLWSVRNDLRILSMSIYLVFAISFGIYVYYTLLNTVGTATNDYSNLLHHDDFTARDQAVIVTVLEWCVFAVRMVFLVIALRVTTTKGFKQLLANSEHENKYLISADEAVAIQVTGHRERLISTVSSSHPRQVAIIDSSHTATSAIY